MSSASPSGPPPPRGPGGAGPGGGAGAGAARADGTPLAPGDRVAALVAGGGYAEYAAVPGPQCLPIPRGLDSVHAAAVPETFFTVWTTLFDDGGPRARGR